MSNNITMLLRFRKRLNDAYSKVPFFYKLYFVSSGITYFYFPQHLNTILINTGSLFACDLIQQLENYVKSKYPDRVILCDAICFTNLISKIGVLGYVSHQLSILKRLHDSFTGLGYGVSKYLLDTTISSARSSAIWGTVTSISVWCGYKTLEGLIGNEIRQFMSQTETHIRQIIMALNDPNNTQIRALITGMETILQNNFISAPIQPRRFTEEELNKIAPMRCPSLGNCISINSDTCAVCTEECTNKQMHRKLPCAHVFHVHCIDNWLLEKSTVCPMCRKDAFVVA